MSTVKELIRTEADGSVSFGDYELSEKTKRSDFEHEGDIYKVKTCREITRLEKNEMFVYESEPGTAVFGMKESSEGVSFRVSGPADAQITAQGSAETDYDIFINGERRDTERSNLGGKISFSVELGSGREVEVRLEKRG